MVADMAAETLVEMVCSEISFLLLLNFSNTERPWSRWFKWR